MLSREHRVPKNLFPLLKKNTLYEGEVFSLRVTKLNKDQVLLKTKCVCVVSRKVAKKAVDRNRAKRAVYSIIKEYLQNKNSSMVIQVFPKKVSIGMSFETQKLELLKLLNNIK